MGAMELTVHQTPKTASLFLKHIAVEQLGRSSDGLFAIGLKV